MSKRLMDIIDLTNQKNIIQEILERKIIMKKKLITLPKDLFEQIEKLAYKNERSVNKEITFLLKSAIKKGLQNAAPQN